MVFVAGRPRAALLLWFFGGFGCCLWLFSLCVGIQIGKNGC